MFEVVVKHLLYGSQIENNVDLKYIISLYRKWEKGDDFVINNKVFENRYIESIYSRKIG